MLNASQRLVNKTRLTWWYIFKTSWRCLQDVFARRLEDVLKTSWRRLGKTSWRCLEDVFARRLEDVLKTSWRRLEDVWTRRIYWSWPRRLEDVWLIRIYSSSSRRLEDVFWRRRRKTSSRRLQDVFIKTNVCWVSNVFAVSMNLLLSSQCSFSRNKSIEAVVLKSLCWSLFYVNKFAVMKRSATLLKRTPMQVFSCEDWEIFKNTFFTEHLRWLLVT